MNGEKKTEIIAELKSINVSTIRAGNLSRILFLDDKLKKEIINGNLSLRQAVDLFNRVDSEKKTKELIKQEIGKKYSAMSHEKAKAFEESHTGVLRTIKKMELCIQDLYNSICDFKTLNSIYTKRDENYDELLEEDVARVRKKKQAMKELFEEVFGE